MRLFKGRFILMLVCAVWAFMTAAGLRVLLKYENQPGPTNVAPARWPGDSAIVPSQDLPTLVMLAHPHCPCTRASIEELNRLMAQAQGRVRTYVLFIKPTGSTEDWEKTDLWQSAARIPGVTVIVDDGGEAKHFNAETSGQTALYDVEGRLLFSGGITASRGHSGDNAGRSAIVSLLNTGTAEITETSVFGCPLFGPRSDCLEKANDKPKH